MKPGHLLAIAALLLPACAGDPSDPLVLPAGGNFTYDASAPDGKPLLIGQIHLEWAMVSVDGREERQLTGTWHIEWAAGADQSVQVGPQVGDGQLSGSEDENGVQLNLNPGMMDNNVFLHAVVDGNTVRGGWTWSTIAGPRTEGRFTATPAR